MRVLHKRRFLITIAILFSLLFSQLYAQESATEYNMSHRMMMLIFQLGVIIFFAKVGNIFFQKLGFPGVLGEIFAGIIISPYLLGSIAIPGFSKGVFPIYSEQFPIYPELYGICTLASIILLFIVGLETDLKLFLRYSLAGGLVGLGGVVFSFLLGDLSAVFFGQLIFNRAISFGSPPAIMLGVISTATSVGITARILTEQKKLDSPEGVTILAAAVIDDVLGILCLAIGMGIITASKAGGKIDFGTIGNIVLKAGVVLIITISIGILTAGRVSTILKWFRDRTSIAIMALGIALLVAGLFEEAGLAMIIGAYLMGLSLSKTDISRAVIERLEPIYSLVVPVFFVVMGMMVNLRELIGWKIIVFGLVYTILAIIAKVVGCGALSMFNRFNILGALRIGFGMLPRGEVALIVTGIALASGFLTPQVFGVSIMMVLITTIIAPPIVMKLFKIERSGLVVPAPPTEEKIITFTLPSYHTADLMILKLLEIAEYEGFFIYTLSQSERIYQLNRDNVAIAVRVEDKNIVFECDEQHINYVNMIMMEVLAEFERTLTELRKPLDTEAITQKIEIIPSPQKEFGQLAKYVTPELLVPRLKAEDKIGAIEELLRVLERNGKITSYEKARKVVLEREKLMSTGLQYGIAVPHGKTDAVSDLVCAIGLKPEGIDFGSIDGEPTRIIVLSLAPKDAVTPHLQFLSIIGQVLSEEGRHKLLECKTPKQMYKVLKELGLNKE